MALSRDNMKYIKVRRIIMGKHAIIVIKNNNNEYLQYFDQRWNSFL